MSAAEHANPANRRALELEEELAQITRRLNDLFGFWATLDMPNHPKRRDLTGDRIAEIEAAEDELEERYRQAFIEYLQVREQVTYLKLERGGEWVIA